MMNKVGVHLAIWLGVLGAWIFVSRGHHPTLLINGLATSILIVASAASFYVNDTLLWPRFRHHRTWRRYAFELFVVVAALDLIAVVAIQKLYDALWGPDPLRYSIGVNIIYEAIFISLHLAMATAFVAALRQRGQAR